MIRLFLMSTADKRTSLFKNSCDLFFDNRRERDIITPTVQSRSVKAYDFQVSMLFQQ